MKKKKKKIIVIVVLLITLTVAVIGGGILLMRSKVGQEEFPFGQDGMNLNGMTMPQDIVSASGVISVGVTEESFEVENLSQGLTIEEVYVSSNQEITQGTKILKLTEESVATARKELEQILRSAELAYRAGNIEYQQNKITAEYDYETAVLEGEQAQAVYEETMSGLTDNVTNAENKLSEAKEQIAEYKSYVDNNSYGTYFKVDEYQALYDENLQLLKDKLVEWDISWEQVTGGGMGQRDPYSNAAVLSKLYSVLEDNLKNLEQAKSQCEDAMKNASFELQTLELQLPSLQQAVAEAEENYEIQAGQAELTREKALASAERAQSDYETALEKAEADYETLKSDYEDAKSNLELFEESVGDGYFYASGSGTILRTMVRVGQKLTTGSVLFMYSNSEEMTVTVAVEQTDISKLTVGEEVYIQTETGEGYSGTVTEINPVTSSDSRTNITYDVTVILNGDTAALRANQSVTVLFGMTAEDLPAGEGFPGGDMEFPEGGGFPGGDFQPPKRQGRSGYESGREMTE